MSRIIAVWSPCSGAGTTSVATGLACALAERDGAALAVDMNFAEPALALALDLFRDREPMSTCLSHLLPLLEGQRLTAPVLEERLLAAPAFPKVRVLAGPCQPLIFPRITRVQVEHLLNVLQRLDVRVVLDLNPMLDFVGTWPALQMADEVVWVTGSSYAGRYHTRRTLPYAGVLNLAGERVLHLFNLTGPCAPAQMTEELGLMPAAALPYLGALHFSRENGRLPWQGDRQGKAYWQSLAQVVNLLTVKGGRAVAQR